MSEQPHREFNVEPDPLIDEVRAIRQAISQRFGHDLRKIADDARQVEEEFRTKTGRFAKLRA